MFSGFILSHLFGKIKTSVRFFDFFESFSWFFEKRLDKLRFFGYNRCVAVKIEYAGVAQSVVQLIRNQQVVCSSHITSSKQNPLSKRKRILFVLFIIHYSLFIFHFYKRGF